MKRFHIAPLTLVAALALVFPVGISLSGCGGGATDAIINTPQTNVKLGVNWAARSRATVDGPSSAQSFKLQFSLGNPSTGGNIVFPVVLRDAALPTYTQNYVSPTKIRTGPTRMNIRFYSTTDGTGTPVAEAFHDVVIGSNGDMLEPGTLQPVGNITLTGQIASVEIPANQSVTVGETGKEITFSAKDANGAVVAVTPGSATFNLTGGGDALELTAGGLANGKAVGTGTATATIDGKTSPAATINVVPNTVVVTANQSVKVGETKNLAVTGTNLAGETIPIPGNLVQLTEVKANTTDLDSISSPENGKIQGIGITTPEKPAKVRATVMGVNSADTNVKVDLGAETPTGSGLKYQEIRLPLSDISPKSGKQVEVHYVGYLASNGQKFDSSIDRGATFKFTLDVTNLIAGFTEGVKTMKVGGQRRLLIPSNLGYGVPGNPPNIPPNADLIFDIQLISAQQ